jgi:hypothetical protein
VTAILINPYALAPVAPAATREYRAVKVSANSTSPTHTFSACDIGSAAVGRRVFADIVFFSLTSVTVNSATIGGVAGTVHHQKIGNMGGGYYLYAVLISAPLDSGATADVVITLNASADLQLKGCATYKVLALQSATAIDTADGSWSAAGGAKSLTVDVQDGGLLFDCQMALWPSGSPTFSYSAGATLDVQSALNGNHGIVAGSAELSADETGRTVTLGATANFRGSRILVSFR